MFGAIAGALIGGGIGLFQQSSANSSAQRAAREANRIQAERDQAQYQRATSEWEISYQSSLTDYYWEQALTEQIRKVEAQAALDQASVGNRLIGMAQANYLINSSALFDQYILGEQVRFAQEGLELQRTVAGYQLEAASLQNQAALLGNQAAGLRNEAAFVQARTAQTVAGYMAQVAENGARADIQVEQSERKAEEVVTALAAQEVEENYKYSMSTIVAALESAVEGNRAIVRTGGGNSAKQLMANRMKQSLLGFGEIYNGRNLRAAKIGTLNAIINDEDAKQIALLATASANAEQQASLAQAAAAVQIQGINIQIEGVNQRVSGINTQIGGVNQQIGFANAYFNQVTLPTFGMAQGQYQRELMGLQFETLNAFQNALQPYRQRELFDPLGPIAGLKPEFYASTPVRAQTGSLAGAFLQGAQQFSPGLFQNTIPDLFSQMF